MSIAQILLAGLTQYLLAIGAFGFVLFLYAELVLLKVPLKEVFWRRRKDGK